MRTRISQVNICAAADLFQLGRRILVLSGPSPFRIPSAQMDNGPDQLIFGRSRMYAKFCSKHEMNDLMTVHNAIQMNY